MKSQGSCLSSRLRRFGAFACVAATVAGCGGGSPSSSAPPPAAAIVVGQRANSAAIGNSPALAALLGQFATDQALVTIIRSDGRPVATDTASLAADAPNDLYRRREQAANEQALLASVLAARARVPQADPLDAIALAARSVDGSSGSRTIVVLDSGLQTVAPLQFELGLLTEKPAAIVTFLRASRELPDLQGTSVVWYGLGETRAPQVTLTIAEYNRLKAIWTAILDACGARSVTIESTPLPQANAPADQPLVSTVPIPAIGSPRALVFALDGTAVDFVPFESTYLHPSHVAGVLASVAQAILAGRFHHVMLTGTTAPPSSYTLSLARAEQVRRTLAADGVPFKAMTVRGVGTHFSGFVPDLNPDGTVNEAAAERDRLVIVNASA